MLENIHIIDSNTEFGLHPHHRLDMTIERLVAEMDKHNIATSLISSTIAVFHDSETGNQITLEAARSNERLIPVGTVNPRTYFGTQSDMQAIVGNGFKILRFYPVEQQWMTGSAAFGKVLKQLSAFKIPIMVEAPLPGDPTTLGRMASGYSAPVILCAVSLDNLSEAVAVMESIPNVMVETHDLHVPGGLEIIASRVGSDRIVFGSAAPRRSIASSLHYILDSELSDADKQLVLGGNIRRVLEAH